MDIVHHNPANLAARSINTYDVLCDNVLNWRRSHCSLNHYDTQTKHRYSSSSSSSSSPHRPALNTTDFLPAVLWSHEGSTQGGMGSNHYQWRNYERRSEAIVSGRQAAGGARGRFWSTDCLLCTTEFSRISKERKKLKIKQNDRNLVYLYSFRYCFSLD